MDVREKLVELLRYVGDNIMDFRTENFMESLASFLIAHGVTVQGDKDINVPTKWISVNDRLPEESGDYLVILDWGTMCVLEFSKVHQAFNASDSIPNDSEIFCTHWMPRPQPPKGE